MGANPCYFGQYALKLLQNGYHVIPVRPRSKKPDWKGWSDWSEMPPPYASVEKHGQRRPTCGIGFVCGRSICAVDIDEDDPGMASRIEDIATACFGPTVLIRHGQRGRRTLLYGVEGDPILSLNLGSTQILGVGRFTVAFGIHPTTGQPYRWRDETPEYVAADELPRISNEAVNRFRRLVEAYNQVPEGLHPAAEQRLPGDSGTLPKNRRGANSPPRSAKAPEPCKDGRDEFLTKAVYYAHLCGGHRTEAAIAGAAWSYFAEHADLMRPKRGGRRPWTIDDAAKKARYLLRRIEQGKLKAQPAWAKKQVALARRVTPEEIASFNVAVLEAHHQGLIPPSSVTVHREMIQLVAAGGTCRLAIETIAERTGLKPRTVNLARAALREAGFWAPLDDKGGRGRITHYVPVLDRIRENPQLVGIPE